MATAQEQQCQSRHYHVGATIDNRYRLTDFIGAGGMACVYRAKEMGAPHDFALKFLKEDYHNMDYLVEYFEEEASSMRDLAHPNIVRFYRFVNQTSYSYIVMDYVDGFALSEVLKLANNKNTAMPLDEVVRVMVQIARALDTIHRDAFVHRDIKPSNVLIDRQTGKAFLTDLGITSAQGSKIEGAGTLAYMAPEQAETWTADQRSDIYAYGILLYEMLTGERPFNVAPGLRGSEAEADILRKHKEMPIPKLTTLRSDLPKELNEMIAKAMAKNPDERYQSVIDFARDVHHVLKHKLSLDMQEFSAIQHRQIEAPANQQRTDSQNVLRLAIGVGITAIIFGALLTFSIFANGELPFGPTDTPAATIRPSSTPTPTTTPTPNPFNIAQEPFVLLDGITALAEPIDTESLIVAPRRDETLAYLRVSQINAFDVSLSLADASASIRYGIAFRIQDDQNYYHFTINPATNAWQIATVTNGRASLLQDGMLDQAPQQLGIAAIDDFFEFRVDDALLTNLTDDQYATGSLAIYVDGDSIQLDTLQVSLLGQEAQSARAMTPTPSVGLADPLRFLRVDVNNLIDTNLPVNTAVDCPRLISTYETIEDTYIGSDNQTVNRIATLVVDDVNVIYQFCRNNPDDQLDFGFNLQAYSEWEATLRLLEAELFSQ